MLGSGFDPELSEGAVKPPVFLTSTFVFCSAEEGRDFFDFTSGRKEPPKGTAAALLAQKIISKPAEGGYTTEITDAAIK